MKTMRTNIIIIIRFKIVNIKVMIFSYHCNRKVNTVKLVWNYIIITGVLFDMCNMY